MRLGKEKRIILEKIEENRENIETDPLIILLEKPAHLVGKRLENRDLKKLEDELWLA